MKKNYYIYIVIFVIILLVVIELKIRSNKSTAPETILIFVKDSDGITPVTGASCKADIYTDYKITEDIQMTEIKSMYQYVDIRKWDIKQDKGYYELKTDLEDYRGDFEIKIVCISPQNKGVSYTILNNKNLPCEVGDEGVLIC